MVEDENGEKETQQTIDFKGLNKFERFGLVAGIIGLIADIISLSTLVIVSQNSQVSLSPNIQLSSFIIWLITFFGISYTVFIASYYTHRITIGKYEERIKRASKRNLIHSSVNSYKRKERMHKGVETITYLIGIPLYFLHFILLYYIVRENIIVMDSVTLKRFLGETNTTNALFRFGGAIALLGVAVSVGMTLLMYISAETIHKAFKK
jgi:hypothetical protein